MKPVRHFARHFLGLCACACFAALAQTQSAGPAAPPRWVVPQAQPPVQIAALAVQTSVSGLQAQTRLEFTLHNPNPRELEATLEFPLAPQQTISGFALDIGGILVPAVPVPKDKGRQVFDDVTRARVDPALLERSAGNAFKLRVYPVPAGGTRRVVLQVTEPLRPGPQGRLSWQLPVDFGQRIGQFSADIALPAASAVQALGALQGADMGRQGSETVIHLQRSDWQARTALALQWQAPASDTVLVASHDDRSYFHAEVAVDATTTAVPLPRVLTLVWDASGSGAQRDHAREFALLDALFASRRAITVRLVLARNVAQPALTFELRGGNWRALRGVLERVAYDGASNAATWNPPATEAEGLVLLFSDGLANWETPGTSSTSGASGAPGTTPLHAISASTRLDAPRLRRLAEARGGRWIDLNLLSTAQALQAVTRVGLRLVDMQGHGAQALVAASVHPEGGRLALAGVLTQDRARISLNFVDGQGHAQTRQIEVKAGAGRAGNPELVPLPAQRWAQLSMAQLEGDRQRHRAEIRRLGEQFRLVSAETSLIVLETVADYLRYEIVPPSGPMRRTYLEQQSRSNSARAQSRSAHLDTLARRFEQRQRWWSREFPKDAPPPAPSSPAIAAAGGRLERRADAAPAPATLSAASPPPPPVAAQAMRMAAPGASAGKESMSETSAPAARIVLRPWEPDAPYARRLREASAAERYAVYLDERAGHTDSTAFFIDAADIFFAKGEADVGLRVLSNLAEMALENRHILRILAYRLQQAQRQTLAIPVLERVRELAPDEPQSWRDLGLALERDGQHARALDMLWEVASRPWDARFSDIDLIALGELNALLARVPALDTSRIDARLLHNLPLDLRAVLTWDADNTDIDLWVTDPNGERAYYGHRLTYQGGAMSRDFTGGYGPEEFSLRRAKPGRYEVRAEFFGHRQQVVSPYTTLMLWLSTGFGTPGQKDEQVVLRLSGQKEQVLVGSFEVAAPAR